jgi:hypothetical protein
MTEVRVPPGIVASQVPEAALELTIQFWSSGARNCI